uniref:Uncharacterized protein n=1 Tax=Magnetospirillum gryphiswaldense TaxID=55518 RepID=Q3BKD6_9PROT|nr:hypothetical protein mgI456 [Magnetospirillum gryphiswaldense MSR-1]CAM78001.1 hypothetical protein MGR_4069 [Magnetospirillum gryphiswaldense MSR-1]
MSPSRRRPLFFLTGHARHEEFRFIAEAVPTLFAHRHAGLTATRSRGAEPATCQASTSQSQDHPLPRRWCGRWFEPDGSLLAGIPP